MTMELITLTADVEVEGDRMPAGCRFTIDDQSGAWLIACGAARLASASTKQDTPPIKTPHEDED